MTEMTGRIRWHHVDGTVVEWFGYVGTVKTPPFHILHPVAREAGRHRFDEWALCCTFLGEEGEPRYGGTYPGAPGQLKAEAERWLEEFVASLGAVFPDQFCLTACQRGAREEAAKAAGTETTDALS